MADELADELGDMLARMIVRKAKTVTAEEAVDLAAMFRLMLKTDRAVVVDRICKWLDLYRYAGAAECVRKQMENYDG